MEADGSTAAKAPAAAPGPVLVATKLHVPPPRAGLVARPELVARLLSRKAHRLALICAPAGWGKTVLLSQWQASKEETRPFAWLSLDGGDSDPVRFWSYAIAALRTIEPGIGETALTALLGVGQDLADVVVAPLINDLAASARQLVLVLDDYHLVHSEPIHDSVDSFIRRLPPGVQLAIASRADPPLRLARLRAAGELTELRAAELAFDEAEADALLNGSLALALDEADVELLQVRTEGWAAGLQLAALSLRDQSDRHAFLEAFAGDERQIGEYLMEVIADQPARLREFLLRTSILERLCPPLCNAITGRDDAADQLHAVERSNLFLVPLDTRREWYRYHQLFRDLLQHELVRAQPTLVPDLHRRAAAWHRDAGDIDRAIAHAMAADELSDAGELIAQHWRRFVLELGQVETAVRWLDRLPREFVLGDSRLCLARGWIAVLYGRHEEVGEYLVAAESCPPPPGPFYAITSSVDSALAQLRTIHAFLCGDVGRACAAARRTLELESDGETLSHAVANINLGESLYFAGEVEEADAVLQAGVRRLQSADWRNEAVIAGLSYRAAIYADAGRVSEAEQIAAEAGALIEDWQHKVGAGEARASQARSAVDLELPLLWTRGMSPRLSHVTGKLLEHRGDLAAADAAFARAVSLSRRGGRRLDLAHALISRAQLKRRQRDHTQAREFAREARTVLGACPDPAMLGELLARTERSLQLGCTPASAPVLPVDLELSERELTVLRLLASDLSQREIGSELYVSLNTVKGHVRSIFRKLGVATRADAVGRARELDLI